MASIQQIKRALCVICLSVLAAVGAVAATKLVRATPVTPVRVEADTVLGGGVERHGEIVVLSTSGNGYHLPNYQNIYADGDWETNGSGTVEPRFVGEEVEAKVSPGSGNDNHSISVTSKEVVWDGDPDDPASWSWVEVRSQLTAKLSVWFTGTLNQDYNVNWTNESMTIDWEGYIHLPNNASFAQAKFEAKTSAPVSSIANNAANEAALVPIKINAGGGGGQEYQWNIEKNGYHSAQYSRTITNSDYADNNGALKYGETVTGIGTTGHTKQSCYVLLKVVLHHSVLPEQVGMTFYSKTEEWAVHNWKLSVTIEEA